MTPAERNLYEAGDEELFRHLYEEYARMSYEAAGAWYVKGTRRPAYAWRDMAWWVLHPRWRPRLWRLQSNWSTPLMEAGPQYQEAILGIRVLTRSAYAAPRLTLDPQDCLPFRIRARPLSLGEMMTR